MSEIPLPQGQAHLRFTLDLGGVRLRMRLDWLTRWGYFNVELYRDQQLVVGGRGLHPNIDLLQDLDLGVGRLYLTGEPATPGNLGNTNTLVHEP